jgi:nitrite reductase/ring-hydroxylating ferredoxin subunit
MKEPWDLGPIETMPEGAPCLRKGPAGQRVVCVRHDDGADALEDRCPHEGYPLSEGEVQGGVLTCKWHNWKFDLATGECRFGGEGVRRYATDIVEKDGHKHLVVEGAVDEASERARLESSLRTGLASANLSQAVRDALRLSALAGERGFAAPFEVILQDALARERYGFDHPEAAGIDLWTWVARGWLAPEPSLAAVTAIAGESLQFLPARARPARVPTTWEEARDVARDLENEGRPDAEGRARALGAQDGERAILEGLLPYVRKHLLDYGHGAIFAGKALELVRAFPTLSEEVAGALTSSLAWATRETSLPPWSATREGIARGAMIDRVGTTPFDPQTRAAFETQVLAGEKEAVHATLEAIARGTDVTGVLIAIGHAAAVRVGRFDLSWCRREDANIGFLDVTHLITCARAMLELWEAAPHAENVSLAVLAASFVGKLRRADDPAAPPPDAFVGERRASRLVEAVRAREPARARAMAARFDRATRLEAYRALAPFAAFEAAVRPILLVHTIKTTEALYRMEIDDPREGGAYLDALVRFLATDQPERTFARTANVAKRFLQDGRPPPGLY